MSRINHLILSCLVLACGSFFTITAAQAFTAHSLDITVDTRGDAIATFRFTLEGLVENAIPQSVLEGELRKGLTTSAEPPELISMDRSHAILLMKKFADTSEVATGTEYRTASMDFAKAEEALQNSALSSVVSADFSPELIVLTFPDSYRQEFSQASLLPSVSHTVTSPEKIARAQVQTSVQTPVQTSPAPGKISYPSGSMNVTSSPLNVNVYLDAGYLGEAPAVFPDIAAGIHTVEFRKDQYTSLKKNVTINDGKTTNIRVVLEYDPAADPTPSSSLPAFILPLAIVVLIATAGGVYYFWNKKRECGGEEEEDSGRESA